MNYINYLQDKTEAQSRTIATAVTLLSDLLHYLESSKFHGADYVHVSTDIYPKLKDIRLELLLRQSDLT